MAFVEPDNQRTAGHRAVAALVHDMGFLVEDEAEFPPYTVDIYMPEIHAAVEVDGPHHRKNRDEARDAQLMMKYGLPVLRVAYGTREDAVTLMVDEFVTAWNDTADERKSMMR